MAIVSPRWRPFASVIFGLLLLVIYNEWLVYYIVLLQCQWPQISLSTTDYSVDEPTSDPLRVMIISDTHLLGSRDGHWFDRLRREWQMERSFQSAMLIHEPEQVFILGDLFDEGQWCSDQEFQYYVSRLHKMFATPAHTSLHVVVGNHDIGFHYMSSDKNRRRFSNAFDAPSVRMLEVKENLFVLLNSMAFEGDGCSMCRQADEQLNKITRDLNCLKSGSEECSKSDKKDTKYSKPIILQHFPLYRHNDANCTGQDSAPSPQKFTEMRPRWDCLDKGVSDMLLSRLRPRLVFSGHTHYSCQVMHENDIPEWTIPSFSWRNINTPSFILMTINRNNYAVSKCYLPFESTVVRTYILGAIIVVILQFFHRRMPFYRRISKSR